MKATPRDRRCTSWWHEPCVIAVPQGELSPWCVALGGCLYADGVAGLSAELQELYAAWSHARVCMTWYAPEGSYANRSSLLPKI